MTKDAPTKAQPDPDEVIGFTPVTDFKGRPFGPNSPEMSFKAGVMSSPVPKSWIESLSSKKTGSETASDKG